MTIFLTICSEWRHIVTQTFLDRGDVTARIIAVVKNFEKVRCSPLVQNLLHHLYLRILPGFVPFKWISTLPFDLHDKVIYNTLQCILSVLMFYVRNCQLQ